MGEIYNLRNKLKQNLIINRSFLNINAIKESIEDGLIEVNTLIQDNNNLSRVLDILLEVEALQELLIIKEEQLDKFIPCF